ncbi:hypothetical protein Noda2021_06410 [Candidatus Dependentiae bacterium Noda2021]|nr:hypothetical protein Noda2021_06410 [Candidatus Dependentiae bacterium Noda2021]
MKKSLNMQDAISFAVRELKKKFVLLVISFGAIPFFLTTLAIVVISVLYRFNPNAINYFSGILLFLMLGLYVLYGLGSAYMSLRFVDNKQVRMRDILSQYSLLIPGIISYMIYWLMVSAGLILLVIPGLIIATRWFFFPYALVEGRGISRSLSYSATLTDKVKFNILGYLLVIAFASMIPVVNFFVPIIASLSSAWMYRNLERQHNSLAIVDIE